MTDRSGVLLSLCLWYVERLRAARSYLTQVRHDAGGLSIFSFPGMRQVLQLQS